MGRDRTATQGVTEKTETSSGWEPPEHVCGPGEKAKWNMQEQKKDYMVEKGTQIDKLKPRGYPDFMTFSPCHDWYNLRKGDSKKKKANL